MASSCMAQRHALLECLADSPCIAEGKSIKECMELEGAASGCKEFRTAFYLCKRGQLDMRKRIKGNMPEDALADKDEPEATSQPGRP
mmetsp:Transcript_56927/g.127123  ORF Transcript_56927/g.127123 Transcript_56927/m.127123 type:complete len:87 (+) Transcript_56927:107-367(+)